jgi:hypothetical protein
VEGRFILAGIDPFQLSARRFLNVLYAMLLEASGEEAVEEMLGAGKPDDPNERALAVLALGGELA